MENVENFKPVALVVMIVMALFVSNLGGKTFSVGAAEHAKAPITKNDVAPTSSAA